MKLIIKTNKMSINLNTMIKNIIKLSVFVSSIAIIISDIYKLTIKPFISGYSMTYTPFGLLTLMIAIIGVMVTYNDLKEYIGG